MPGRGRRFTKKQDRMASHIARAYGGGKRARSIAYATVNMYRKRVRASKQGKQGKKRR